jgi:hypothetical protein
VIPKIYIAETTVQPLRGSRRSSACSPITRVVTVLACLVLALARAAGQSAQDGHTVTVVYPQRHDIVVAGGDITLTMVPKVDGSDPDPVTHNGCDLIWMSNRNNRKRITVQSDLGSPTYTLTVQPSNIRGQGTPGAAASPLPIAMDGGVHDFLLGVRRCLGQCDLIYTASARAGDPPVTEVHTVTYTFLNR